MRTIHTAALLSSALAPCVVARPSMARPATTQSMTDQPGGGSPTRIGRSEDMIVTAQRRVQMLFEVPPSVSGIGGDSLERQQANSFIDYLISGMHQDLMLTSLK